MMLVSVSEATLIYTFAHHYSNLFHTQTVRKCVDMNVYARYNVRLFHIIEYEDFCRALIQLMTLKF